MYCKQIEESVVSSSEEKVLALTVIGHLSDYLLRQGSPLCQESRFNESLWRCNVVPSRFWALHGPTWRTTIKIVVVRQSLSVEESDSNRTLSKERQNTCICGIYFIGDSDITRAWAETPTSADVGTSVISVKEFQLRHIRTYIYEREY